MDTRIDLAEIEAQVEQARADGQMFGYHLGQIRQCEIAQHVPALVVAVSEAQAQNDATKLLWAVEKDALLDELRCARGVAEIYEMTTQRDTERAVRRNQRIVELEAEVAELKAKLDGWAEAVCGTTERNGNGCSCWTCNPNAAWFIVCETCGCKRCPHATNHAFDCSGSNKVGQRGSRFEEAP